LTYTQQPWLKGNVIYGFIYSKIIHSKETDKNNQVGVELTITLPFSLFDTFKNK